MKTKEIIKVVILITITVVALSLMSCEKPELIKPTSIRQDTTQVILEDTILKEDTIVQDADYRLNCRDLQYGGVLVEVYDDKDTAIKFEKYYESLPGEMYYTTIPCVVSDIPGKDKPGGICIEWHNYDRYTCDIKEF